MLFTAVVLSGHPMGNFSVSHYAKLNATARGIDIQYALDLAEIPTFELLRDWKLDRNSPQADLDKRASEQMREWLENVAITADGKPVEARLESVSLVIADGAGNLPILRVTARARVAGSFSAHGGALEYEDHNYPERAGWKEIVIAAAPGATLRKASQGSKDISQALTKYPPDPTIAPPQDLRAQLEWAIDQPAQLPKPSQKEPVIAPIRQPHSAPAAPVPATLTTQAAPRGAVVRGDFLSRLMHQRELSWWMILTAIGAAFALGAAHALTPGHGKTIVAAYLVGSRGTFKHAAFLGAMVTLTHTVAVFALGLAILFLFRFVVPERIAAVLGVISGVSIVAVGGWMLYKRIRKPAHSHSHAHHHDHHHGAHTHHHHEHDHAHSHVPDKISWGGLMALGASGGIVPCESALVLLLGAIALGRVGLGLALLVSFSLGLALVLVLIGVLVLYARNLLPQRKRNANNPLFHWLPVASAVAVMVIGLIMTGVSLGWIQPKWLIS